MFVSFLTKLLIIVASTSLWHNTVDDVLGKMCLTKTGLRTETTHQRHARWEKKMRGRWQKKRINIENRLCFYFNTCFKSGSVTLPSLRLSILHYGPTALLHRFPHRLQPSTHLLNAHMLSALCGATQLAEDVQQAPSWGQWDESRGKGCVYWGSGM